MAVCVGTAVRSSLENSFNIFPLLASITLIFRVMSPTRKTLSWAGSQGAFMGVSQRPGREMCVGVVVEARMCKKGRKEKEKKAVVC